MIENKLSEQDQARVDAVLSRGTYASEHKPFRPWLLLSIIVGIMTALSFFSYGIAVWHGVV